MDMLMLGVGVGFDTLGAGKPVYAPVRLPYDACWPVKIPDTREGWVWALRQLFESYTSGRLARCQFNYSLIRPAGSPIAGFGGVASGPEPLKEMLEGVRGILDAASVGGELTSTHINDIMALIGRCVVSGGVRRSAEICFIESADEVGQQLKNKQLHPDENENYRWAANHSVKCATGDDYDSILSNNDGIDELGVFWLDNARRFGRMGRRPSLTDLRVRGCNPCAEQSLEHKELCCLVEIFPSRIESLYEFQKVLKYAYLFAKTVTTIPIHDAETGRVVTRNRRIGCSLTGIQQSIEKLGNSEFYRWCGAGYKYLGQLDERYSEWLGIARSVKMTSVKPSGTVSKLPGVSSGIHFPISDSYFQVIRFASSSPYLPLLRNAGYNVVDLDPAEPNTTAVYFGVIEDIATRGESEVSMWEQAEHAAKLQHYWADNQVSITVKYNPEERNQIPHLLRMYEDRLKAISFFPNSNHSFEHAPWQPASREEVQVYLDKLSPINYNAINETHEADDEFCSGETCTIPVKD
jgi:ribonucleoside-triphosphate reductase